MTNRGMKEAYCSFEVAKLLKEKGFRLNTYNDYWRIDKDDVMWKISSIGAYTSKKDDLYCYYIPEDSYTCPTHQMAMAWLREEKHISIIIEFDVTKRGYCPYVYVKDYDCDWVCEWRVNMPMKYEEAVEAALKYALENLL